MKTCLISIAPIKSDKLSDEQWPKSDLENEHMKKIPYSLVVGNLMYAQTCTIPDISYDVSMLSKHK